MGDANIPAPALSIPQELLDARIEYDWQRTLVQDEMNGHSARGELWQNGRCKAWPDYELARDALYTLRDKFRV